LKLSFLTKALLSGIVTASILAGSLIATLPARAAGTETMSVTPATQSVANGTTTITVSIVVNTSAATRGWGAELDFIPAQLQETGYTYGSTFYTSAYGTPFNNTPTVNNTTGAITGFAQTLLTGSGGPTGTGTLVTVTFSAVSSNSVDTITLNSDSGLADVNASPLNPTLVNGQVVVGTPPTTDYAVETPATVAVTGTPTEFNVTFAVKNTGTLNGAATTATVTPPTGDGSAQTVTVPALNAGVTSATLSTATPFTLTGSNENVTIQMNALAGDIDAADKSTTVNYAYTPPATNPTGVNGTITGTLTFTQPPTVNFGTLTLGTDTVATSMNVLTNQDWQVTVAGTAPAASGGYSGYMTKYNTTTSTYVPQVTLHDPLYLNAGGGNLTPDPDPSDPNIPVNNSVELSGTARTLSTGVAQDQNPNGTSGETRTINFDQTIVGSDAALASGYIYHNVVAFTCSTNTY
jgi:hypothetical protein